MMPVAEDKRKKPRKPADNPKPSRKGKPLNVWIPDDLREALDLLLKKTRRMLTTEVIIALENRLAAEGLWPPKDSND